MSSFQDINVCFCNLQKTITEALPGINAIDNVTVSKPSEPLDELHFQKLVSWSYVALIEALPVVFRQLLGLIRNTDSDSYSKIIATRDSINSLRTVQNHNLDKPSKSNIRHKTVAEVWISSNGGSPFSWKSCCEVMSNEMLEIFSNLSKAWKLATTDDVDRAAFLNDIKIGINHEWQPNHFDEIVITAAKSIGLSGFDSVGYRKLGNNFENWKKLISLFENRIDASRAIERAITQELRSQFGSN